MKLLCYLLILFAALVTSYGTVHGNEPLDVHGKLVNSTAGGPIPAGVSIAFHSEQIGASPGMIHSVTGKDGSFLFSGIEVHDDTLYGISAIYDGATYAKWIDLKDSSPVEIKVYNSSDSDDIVTGFNASILFTAADPITRYLSIMEMITLTNETDLTYVPGSEPMDLLRFGLPIDAEGLVVDTGIPGADWLQVDRGFALIASLPPGRHDLMFTYRVPYSGSSFSYQKTWRYGAESLRIVVPKGMSNINIDIDHEIRVLDIDNQKYDVVESVGLERGKAMSLELMDLSVPTFSQSFIRNFRSVRYEYVGPASLFVVLLSAAVFGISKTLRLRRRSKGWFSGSGEQEVIQDMIVELEADLQEGNVSFNEHRRRLEILRRRLSSISES